MFDKQSLDALAKQAKESLARQEEEGTPQEVVGDIYSEFRDDNSDITAPEETREEFVINNKPSFYDELPRLTTDPDGVDEERPVINPFDKPIFPGGPLESQVASWKKQWIGYDVYVVEIVDQFFVFRTLNRYEYKQIVSLQNTDPLMREEIICETVTLWPSSYKWDKMATDKAGVPSTFAQVIMEKSGFTKDYAIQVL